MKTYTKAELAKILKSHAKWLHGESGGEWADLSEADLTGADLTGALWDPDRPPPVGWVVESDGRQSWLEGK